jgi:hypothetical protein
MPKFVIGGFLIDSASRVVAPVNPTTTRTDRAGA